MALEDYPVPRTYPTQLYLQAGFAVLAPNFRGSSNYGASLRLANIKSQGFGDMDDVLTGIDHLVAQGIADPDRLGVMGWSYGGFLSIWIGVTRSGSRPPRLAPRRPTGSHGMARATARKKFFGPTSGASRGTTGRPTTGIHPATRSST